MLRRATASRFPEAVPWCAGALWWDLPGESGNRSSRFRRRAGKGAFERVFNAVGGEPDPEGALADGTIVQARQKASGAKGGTRHQAIGRSRGGLTTGIVAPVPAPARTGAHDMRGVAALIHDVSFEALLADRAFDADRLPEETDERGATVVIPPGADRTDRRECDAGMYKRCHLIENRFARIREFGGTATRYDRTGASYIANWRLTATLIVAG